jgi:hypothetical protein
MDPTLSTEIELGPASVEREGNPGRREGDENTTAPAAEERCGSRRASRVADER